MGLFSWRKKDSLVPQRWNVWWPIISEPFSGAWQKNKEWKKETVLAHHAVYSCITLIANDVGKMRPKLMRLDSDGIRNQTTDIAISPLLRRPNRYQNHIQFKECWTTSKLISGNTFALKERDNQGVVRALYILSPQRVQVLVADDGSVFYRLSGDKLNTIPEDDRTVPASEIIHDRINCVFHPLMGVSPLFAAGLAAHGGLEMMKNSNKFFEQDSNPGGIIMVPGSIPQDKADKLKEKWESGHQGSENRGKIAVLSDGMKFQPLRMSSVDSQLIEQMQWNAKIICSTFHVPPWKIGIEPMPSGQKVNEQNQIYYSDCLQILIEEFEASMDDGLGIEGTNEGIELDLDDLIRMDQGSLVNTMKEGVGAGIMAPNEGRKRMNLAPVSGGQTPYLQVQNYSLAALDRRDTKEDAEEKDVQTEALNGAQVSALQGLIEAAALGQIPIETVAGAIAAAFPLMTADQIDQMLSPIKEAASSGTDDAEPSVEMAMRYLTVKAPEEIWNEVRL